METKRINNKLPISVIINTYNEEKNIKDCLESVKWAEEIIVVDMYSEDNTVNIAKKYTDKIYFFEKCNYVEPARKFAVEQAKKDWIFILDADELVPVNLVKFFEETIRNDLYDVVRIPRKNYLFGKLMEGSGFGYERDLLVRFFKKGFVKFSNKIHSIPQIDKKARLHILREYDKAIIHFNYITMEQFIDKLNRYTTIEAENMFDYNENPNFFKQIYMILREIGGRFIFKKGFKDGLQGFYLSLLSGCYIISSYSKLFLMKKFESKDYGKIVEKEYSKIKKTILEQHKNLL